MKHRRRRRRRRRCCGIVLNGSESRRDRRLQQRGEIGQRLAPTTFDQQADTLLLRDSSLQVQALVLVLAVPRVLDCGSDHAAVGTGPSHCGRCCCCFPPAHGKQLLCPRRGSCPRTHFHCLQLQRSVPPIILTAAAAVDCTPPQRPMRKCFLFIPYLQWLG